MRRGRRRPPGREEADLLGAERRARAGAEPCKQVSVAVSPRPSGGPRRARAGSSRQKEPRKPREPPPPPSAGSPVQRAADTARLLGLWTRGRRAGSARLLPNSS